MREMLASQMFQTHLCDVYVSYTGLSLDFDDPRVHLMKQPEPQLAQFQHYKRLVGMLLKSGVLHSENYAIFTDDDDIMDPERNATYLRLIGAGSSVEVVRIDKSVVRFSNDCNINEHGVSLQNASGIVIEYARPSEYVDLCIRGDLLLEFMDEVDGEKYESDCKFNMVVVRYIFDNPAECIEIEANKPLYYYRYSIFRCVRHKYLKEANNLQ
jgi:hypothetical protein